MFLFFYNVTVRKINSIGTSKKNFQTEELTEKKTIVDILEKRSSVK